MESPAPSLDRKVLLGLLALARDRAEGKSLLQQLQSGERIWGELTRRERSQLGVRLLDWLRERSMDLRFDDPKGMVELAKMVRDLANALSLRRYGRKVVADLRSRAWAELGQRAPGSGRSWTGSGRFVRARDCLALGTGLLGPVVQVMELMGSLLSDQRRFREAVSVFERCCGCTPAVGE